MFNISFAINGLEALNIIKNNSPGTVDVGMNGFVRKPIEIEELIKVLLEL